MLEKNNSPPKVFDWLAAVADQQVYACRDWKITVRQNRHILCVFSLCKEKKSISLEISSRDPSIQQSVRQYYCSIFVKREEKIVKGGNELVQGHQRLLLADECKKT